jgi:hypothetical protein
MTQRLLSMIKDLSLLLSSTAVLASLTLAGCGAGTTSKDAGAGCPAGCPAVTDAGCPAGCPAKDAGCPAGCPVADGGKKDGG